jgi:preprotein translocase subunit SecA
MNDKEFEPRAVVIEKIRMLVAQQKKAHGLSKTPAPVPLVAGSKAGRNDPCPCGSGKKYKKCCALKGSAE